MNEQLTSVDLRELERILKESGMVTPADIGRAKAVQQGLGLFACSVVGLEREAAKKALVDFSRGIDPESNQIEFLNQIVNRLTEHGNLEPGRWYKFLTSISPRMGWKGF